MGRIFKFGKKLRKLNEQEELVNKKLVSIMTFIESLCNLIRLGPEDNNFVIFNQTCNPKIDILRLSFEVVGLLQELKKDDISLTVLKKLHDHSSKSLEEMKKLRKKTYVISAKTIAKKIKAYIETVDHLRKYLVERIKKEKIEEEQLKSLATVSKNFLQYNGSDLFFCLSDFGIMVLASQILEFLAMDKKIKEYFYVEESVENLIHKPNNMLTNKSNENKARLQLIV